MSGAQGLGQAVGSQGSGPMPVGQQFSQPNQMSGGLGNQYQMTPPQGMPMQPQMPDSVQRMPGGFGLSPQLLQMIASLQARNPKFTPQMPVQPQFQSQSPFANRTWLQGGQSMPNPYYRPNNYLTNTGGGSGGSGGGGGGAGAGGPGGGS